ncbi:hypothetical protein P4O66_010364 [Electrophorus voltai]|uniref:Guanylate cyclase domain-containing protein n=1 Tax=Electrophorus voltai TaxID=2609070 RepID=A0AAD8Z9Y7_9TELE|nr:hypothetical protein P4O66_010364 [Electrophorus voltai]
MKAVADRLRNGITALKTYRVFPNVTILFSNVVKFNEICIHITPVLLVDMLNGFIGGDIRDAYMVVAKASNNTMFHAHNICDMALDMLSSINHLKDPPLGICIGVVGLKMPRYCLLGDTVNTASHVQSNGVGMQIHISQTTKDHLEFEPYIIEERCKIFVKVKGYMKTYWLKGKKNFNQNKDNLP